MIVDNQHAVRRGIKCLVETNARYHVVAEASNGRDALKKALEFRPEIAILDFVLPALNGLELARKLMRVMPHLHVLLYTAHDSDELVSAALRAGVRGFVLKSDKAENLVAALDALSHNQPFFTAKVSEILLDRFLKSPRFKTNALTMREREIVQLIAEGRLNKQIAQILAVTIKTVETHRASMMRKLELHNTADVVRYAVRNNIAQA